MSLTKIYTCPGIHAPRLTDAFVAHLSPRVQEAIVGRLPPSIPPYAPRLILDHLGSILPQSEGVEREGIESEGLDRPSGVSSIPPLLWIAFSAGVVGALLAARSWQRRGHPVAGLIAVDGWGVPMWADFPVYSLSPDRFAYDMTRGLRPKLPHFYADPAVSHLALWEKPQEILGWQESPGGQRLHLTAAEYLERMIDQSCSG